MSLPLFPIKLCIYQDDGRYSPIDIVSNDQLHGVGMRSIVQLAMAERRKIVMEDPSGFCVFHAEDGRILFPTEDQIAEAR